LRINPDLVPACFVAWNLSLSAGKLGLFTSTVPAVVARIGTAPFFPISMPHLLPDAFGNPGYVSQNWRLSQITREVLNDIRLDRIL